MPSAATCPVNVIWDFTLPITVGTHMLLAPPAVPAPVVTVGVEMIATMMWTAGFALGKNKFTNSVFHKGVFVMQEGHDIGPLIPDVTIPPSNLWYVTMWPFSKREVKFSASTVKMDGKATGCTTIWPPFVMLCCCEPVSIPFGYSVICPLNTVRVGLTAGDIWAGVLSIAVSMALDLIFYRVSKGSWNPLKGVTRNANQQINRIAGREGMRTIAGEVFGSSGKEFLKSQGNNLLKNAISGLAGAGITALTGTGNPQIKIGLGNAWVGGEGVIDVSGEGQHGAEAHGFGFQGGAGSSDSQTPWSNFTDL